MSTGTRVVVQLRGSVRPQRSACRHAVTSRLPTAPASPRVHRLSRFRLSPSGRASRRRAAQPRLDARTARAHPPAENCVVVTTAPAQGGAAARGGRARGGPARAGRPARRVRGAHARADRARRRPGRILVGRVVRPAARRAPPPGLGQGVGAGRGRGRAVSGGVPAASMLPDPTLVLSCIAMCC